MVGVLGCSLATLSALSDAVGGQLLLRQLTWGGVGLALFFLVSRLHPSVLQRVAPFLYLAALAALVLVLIFGEVRSGTRGWFALGPVTIQPSEFARVTTMLAVAAWLGSRSGQQLSLREAATAVALVVVACALILAEPDFGIAVTYLPIVVGGLWIGGLPNRTWVLLILLGVVAAVVGWNSLLKPYQKERVLTVISPDRDPYGAGYQVRQSKIAVGSGQMVGHGLGRGTQSLLRFLPAQHTDFVFAAWAESTGFIGGTGLLVAYALLLGRLGLVAISADTRFGLVLAVVVGSWLAFQVVVNLGMVLGWLPTTGITLPLFSYGGSSLVSTCAALGLVQSVWRHRLVNQ